MNNLYTNTNSLLAQAQSLIAHAQSPPQRDSAWFCLYRCYLSLLAELAEHWQLSPALELEPALLAQAVQNASGYSEPLTHLAEISVDGKSWLGILRANFQRLMNPPRASQQQMLIGGSAGLSSDDVEHLELCFEQLQLFVERWRGLGFEG